MSTSETLEALERYMDRGGRMLVTLEVTATDDRTKLRKSGIEDFLKKFGELKRQITQRGFDQRSELGLAHVIGHGKVSFRVTPFERGQGLSIPQSPFL